MKNTAACLAAAWAMAAAAPGPGDGPAGSGGGCGTQLSQPAAVPGHAGCRARERCCRREQSYRRGSSLGEGDTDIRHQMLVLYLGCIWAERLQNERVRLGCGQCPHVPPAPPWCTLLPTLLYLYTKINHLGALSPPFSPKNYLQEATCFIYCRQRTSHPQTPPFLLISS